MKIKITALIEKDLIEQTIYNTNGKNITEAITKALTLWNSQYRLMKLSEIIKSNPIKFKHSASKVRKLSRRRG